MADPTHTDDATRLAETLRNEAARSRPAFSEALHARVCAAIERTSHGSSCLPPRRPSFTSRRPWWSLAAAAALVLGAAWAAWWLRGPRDPAAPPHDVRTQIAKAPPAPTPVPEPPADPDTIFGSTGQIAEQFSAFVDSALTSSQWAYLDHDAQVAMQLLVDQLPLDVAPIE
jgi:hypothetical protein